jgi:predicted lipoprotein with Yx(FWY)xxD motif
MARSFSRTSVATLVAAAAVFLGIATALAQNAPATSAATTKGKALVDGKGMTLYIFDRDSAGKSNCSGPCATIWVPFAAPAGATTSGDWSVVSREDGAKQWAFKGRPLYAFNKDAKPGDATGDGVNSVWHIAAP